VIEFPFILGSRWSDARFIEVIVDRGKQLEGMPMSLHIQPLTALGKPDDSSHHRDGRPGILLKESAHLSVLSGSEQTGDLWAKAGSIWRPPVSGEEWADGRALGASREGAGWRLEQRRASVGLPTAAGQRHLATLRFTMPPQHREEEATIQIWQRNDRRIVVGAATLVLQPHKARLKAAPGRRAQRPKAAARAGRK
jgi:hypothetical protein